MTTTNLPLSMCTPRAESINGNSCTSMKLLMAFSWICTINLFIYLIFLVTSAVLHQKQYDTVWRAQIKSYPWYNNFYCHKLGSSPELVQHHQPVAISAPQPWRPIRLLRLSVLSSLYRPEHTPDRSSGVIEHSAPPPPPPPPSLPQPPPAMQQAMPVSAVRTSLYPLHVLAVLEPTVEPAIPEAFSFYPHVTHSHHHDRHHRHSSSLAGGPPPLSNWPRADIMSRPPQRPAVGRRRVPASALPSAAEFPRPRARREEGRPPRSNSRRVPSDQHV